MHCCAWLMYGGRVKPCEGEQIWSGPWLVIFPEAAKECLCLLPRPSDVPDYLILEGSRNGGATSVPVHGLTLAIYIQLSSWVDMIKNGRGWREKVPEVNCTQGRR